MLGSMLVVVCMTQTSGHRPAGSVSADNQVTNSTYLSLRAVFAPIEMPPSTTPTWLCKHLACIRSMCMAHGAATRHPRAIPIAGGHMRGRGSSRDRDWLVGGALGVGEQGVDGWCSCRPMAYPAIGHRFGVTAPTGGGCPASGGQTHRSHRLWMGVLRGREVSGSTRGAGTAVYPYT